MSTHKNLDKICAAIVILSLLGTVVFINGESLGITKVVDEDAEQFSDTQYFTSSDQNGTWDPSNPTVITLTGDGAAISGNGAYTNDGNVVITNAGYYEISGTLTDGYISVDAYDSSKVWILLNGVTIDCSDDACIRVDQADKVFLTLAEGSQNTLTSGSVYTDTAIQDGTDGAVFAHDDLTINGSGDLTVAAEYRHGIAANDDLVITGGNIKVTAAADAIHANDSIRIKDADITVKAGDDGIVTSNEIENGYFYIESGTLKIAASDDAIHTTGDFTMAGGSITISAGDDGIHSDSSVFIRDGNVQMEECYEGIEALIIDVSGGDVTIYPEDDGFNANGGSGDMFGMGGGGNHGSVAGSTDGGMQAPPDMDSTGEGMQAPPDMGSTGGGMQAPPDMDSAGEGMQAPPDMDSTGEGMQAPPDMSGTGEDMQAPPQRNDSDGGAQTSAPDGSTQTAADQAEEETYISISGGTITIINDSGRDADGLDSNGDIRISGGTIYVSLLGTGSNNAIDCGSESGGVAEITGGTIIACGASSMAEAFDSGSTQASILYNISSAAEAGSTLAVEDMEGNVLVSWQVPCQFTSAIISCPQMKTGESYKVVIGDNTETITIEEISASYGDGQSGMSGGNMNRGGGKSKNRFGEDSAQAGTTGKKSSGFRKHGGAGDASSGAEQPVEGGDASSEAAQPVEGGDTSSEAKQVGPPDMQEQAGQQELSQEAEDQVVEQTVSAQPVESETWKKLGICAVLLIAGIAVVKIYKR